MAVIRRTITYGAYAFASHKMIKCTAQVYTPRRAVVLVGDPADSSKTAKGALLADDADVKGPERSGKERTDSANWRFSPVSGPTWFLA